MNFEYTYLVVIALLLLVGIFYISPYELTVNEDEDDE
ncbi:hypothetical protein SAMN05428947_102227 [Mucilaginibacter sp. OK283]|jgi:hypothetical protein|nr:hypothetical protein SAMN05428947_102227 [Mucilaginibacter sp. OK283]